MQILLSSQNTDTFQRAVDYTVLFAEQAAVTLLYAYQNDQDRQEALDELDSLEEKIRLLTNCAVRVVVREGETKDVILDETRAKEYDLMVFGSPLHPHFKNLRPKHDARQIAKRISIPMLVIFAPQDQLSRVLMCIGGTESDQVVLHQGGALTAQAGAECSILHVMSQIPLRASADMEDLERDAKSLIKHESKEGKYLEDALESLRERGNLSEDCQLIVRHGLTVEKIIEESERGNYDLIVIGGLEVAPHKSWQELRELVQEDIADRVLAESAKPVLIAREPDRTLNWKDF